MKKIIIIIFLITNFLVFSKEIYIDTLNTIKIAGQSYISENDLDKFELKEKSDNNEITFYKDDLSIKFLKTTNEKKENIIVNKTGFYSTDILKMNANKIYFNLDFLTNILGYKKNGNTFQQNSNDLNLQDKYPQKIISLSPAVTEKIFAIGAGEKLIGRTLYCKFPEEAKKVDSIGTMFEPNLEIILSKEPDLVLAETHFNQKTLKVLTEFGIECSVKNSPKNLSEIYTNILELGEKTGRFYEARTLVYIMKKKQEKIEAELKNSKNKPTVYFVLGTGKNEYTAGKDTYISEMIKTAGGRNIADNTIGWSYSAEKLVSENPEIVFGSKKNIDIFKSKYSNLNAVKEGKCFYIDETALTLPGPRALNEGIEMLFNIFYKN